MANHLSTHLVRIVAPNAPKLIRNKQMNHPTHYDHNKIIHLPYKEGIGVERNQCQCTMCQEQRRQREELLLDESTTLESELESFGKKLAFVVYCCVALAAITFVTLAIFGDGSLGGLL